jgi:hypothetical protein
MQPLNQYSHRYIHNVASSQCHLHSLRAGFCPTPSIVPEANRAEQSFSAHLRSRRPIKAPFFDFPAREKGEVRHAEKGKKTEPLQAQIAAEKDFFRRKSLFPSFPACDSRAIELFRQRVISQDFDQPRCRNSCTTSQHSGTAELRRTKPTMRTVGRSGHTGTLGLAMFVEVTLERSCGGSVGSSISILPRHGRDNPQHRGRRWQRADRQAPLPACR